jgi:hypothetical protein
MRLGNTTPTQPAPVVSPPQPLNLPLNWPGLPLRALLHTMLLLLLSISTAQTASQTIRITVPYILQAEVDATEALYTHLGDSIEIEAVALTPLTVRLSTNDHWTLQIITPRDAITVRGTNGAYAPLQLPPIELQDGEQVRLIITRG